MKSNKRMLEITECFQCPDHKISITSNRAFCGKTGKGITLDDIPDWCPLPEIIQAIPVGLNTHCPNTMLIVGAALSGGDAEKLAKDIIEKVK